MSEENPYAAPAITEVSAAVESDAEMLRREHLTHEVALKGMGGLLLIGVVVVVLVSLLFFFQMGTNGFGLVGGPELVILVVVGLVITLQTVAGVGLRRLAPSAKVPAIIASALAIINFPIGTIFGAYFLYLVLCRKGQTILSPSYRDVIEQTPHIKYRTPIWNWIVLGLVLLVIVGSAVALFFLG